MDVLVLNKINGHENEINEIKNVLKHTKSDDYIKDILYYLNILMVLITGK